MPAPEILSFGDGLHDPGETGLTIEGGGFGAFPGAAWIFQNSDRSGATDQLTVGSWNDIQLSSVSIPASPNNTVGTCYLFVQREDLAWSQGFSFSLVESVPALNCYLKTADLGLELPRVVWDVKIRFRQPRQANDYITTDYGSLVIYQVGPPPAQRVAYRFSNAREFLERST